MVKQKTREKERDIRLGKSQTQKQKSYVSKIACEPSKPLCMLKDEMRPKRATDFRLLGATLAKRQERNAIMRKMLFGDTPAHVLDLKSFEF